jgi:hypothetical protein
VPTRTHMDTNIHIFIFVIVGVLVSLNIYCDGGWWVGGGGGSDVLCGFLLKQ